MEELNVNEIKKRADSLVKEWQTRLIGQTSKSRGLSLDVIASTAHTAFHYIPYILATIYYAWMIINKRKTKKHEIKNDTRSEKDISKIVDIWIDESIDRILQLAPKGKIDENNFIKDANITVKELCDVLSKNDLVLVSGIISNKMFNVLKKYNPDIENTEKDLIDYIVEADLNRLNGIF